MLHNIHRAFCNLSFHFFHNCFAKYVENKTLQTHTSPENEHRSDIRELWSTYVPIRDPRPTIPEQELNLSITSTHNIRRRFGAANNNMRCHSSNASVKALSQRGTIWIFQHSPQRWCASHSLTRGSRLGFAIAWNAACMKQTVFT